MADEWFVAEFAALDLHHRRRENRTRSIIQRMAEQPSGSVKQTFTAPAEWKAVYRFLASEAFTTADLEQALRQACLARCAEHDLILAVQDTAELFFAASPALEEAAHQLWVHTALAVSPEGVPLGVLHQQRWTRPADAPPTSPARRQRPLEAKESYRWIATRQAVEGGFAPAQTVLTVADREADIFELFALPRPEHSQLLIRASRNRRVSAPEKYLWEALAATPVAGTMQVLLRRHPQRPARLARLEVRWRELELHPPGQGQHRADLAPPTVTAIWVRESGGPPQQAPVDWLLLTTLPVTDLGAACACVRYYTLRWLVERYHYTLKSGCGIEASQLRSREALERLLVLYSAVAWRLLWLTYESRRDSGQPCTVAFSAREWQTLYRLRWGKAQALPDEPPALGAVIRWLGRIGGHPDRRGDSEPGVKVLWRGLMRLQDILIGVELATSPEVVGNA
jgi:hypothetical protein